MFHRYFFGLTLAALLVSLLALTINIRPARASEVIYIKSDGSIDPQTSPIDRNDDVYTLTGDIITNTDGIIIGKNNAELNGAGYSIQGTGAGNGITLSNRSNVTIRYIRIRNFSFGMILENSSSNGLFENNMENNSCGIYLRDSSENMLSDNTVKSSKDKGVYLFSSSHNALSSNIISYNKYGITLDFDSNDTVLSNNTVTNNNQGITLFHALNCVFSSNTLANNQHGIIFTDTAGEKVFHNNFVNNTIQVKVNLWCSPHILWHDGFPSGGNYWSDYTDRYPNTTEIGTSGIWNTPYVINEGSIDKYPLMHPYWITADVNHDLKVNILDVVKICASYGTTPSASEWNPQADIAEPYGVIDIQDVMTVTTNYGKKWSIP